ncbi:N-acetyltransferase [Paenibacillus daejeonensis]|uniref:N-acetyltransferase n=1 Tax=Paenibacillus daejeonensis TaxID=135193 RepID=UPI0006890B8C|nr:N-acetyltransferase [Paenibacillus daejeonensis]
MKTIEDKCSEGYAIQIRSSTTADIPRLVDVWERCSQISHAFIPASYWEGQREAMAQQYLPAAESYVLESDGEASGFISLMDTRVAALFVDEAQQGKGYGKALLNHAKSLRSQLNLQVYQKNESAVRFYKLQGFDITEECADPHTGEQEFVMVWARSS